VTKKPPMMVIAITFGTIRSNCAAWPDVQSAQQPQTIAPVRVYPAADGTFTLIRGDDKTYA
jgi:crotonobetainyl-CoA:carnitine CoA-transferase CaiB-like acyl-CoA transferase